MTKLPPFTFLLFIALHLNVSAFAQNFDERANETMALIKELDDFRWDWFDDTTYNDKFVCIIGPDSLALIIADKMIPLLCHPKSLEYDFTKMGKGLLAIHESGDRRLRSYTYYHYSGGTAGMIGHTILQWTKENGTLGAYNLFRQRESGFKGTNAHIHEIHELNSPKHDLYLLYGDEKCSSLCFLSTWLVVQLKGPYLILDYPAFPDKSPMLTVENCRLEFKANNLTEDKERSSDLFYCGDFLKIMTSKFPDALEIRGLSTNKSYGLWFNGYKFVPFEFERKD